MPKIIAKIRPYPGKACDLVAMGRREAEKSQRGRRELGLGRREVAENWV